MPVRQTRDGSQVVVPWYQALVFEGRVFGLHIGSLTTPIAGHATITSAQPEGAVYIAATGTSVLPLYIWGTQETGSTTLATGGLMCAISNISVGAGTSTSVTASIFNNKMTSVGVSTAAAAGQAYTGNGTDPLTSGNFLELDRATSIIDSDAATSGIVPPVMHWRAGDVGFAPVAEDICSLLLYGEAAANTLFGGFAWAELPSTAFN